MQEAPANLTDGQPNDGVDPELWVDAYADMLYRQALLRVREPTVAEDLVQEVFLAAWRMREKGGRVLSEKAWLCGILRHKVADFYRQLSRERGDRPEELREFHEQQFVDDKSGVPHWRLEPREWPDPHTSLERQEFWGVLHGCAHKLPARVAQAFLLRELEELSAADICKLLEIQPNNLFVMLHRARLALRRCLEVSWFGREPQKTSRQERDLC